MIFSSDHVNCNSVHLWAVLLSYVSVYVCMLSLCTLEYKSVEVCEELVINAATTINNLSFYKVKSSAVQDKKLRIAESKGF